MPFESTIQAETTGCHLGDLRRELADWLRARTGWPESVVAGACRLTAAVTLEGTDAPVEADIEVDHESVHLHLESCREADLVTEVEGGAVHLAAHAGDVVLEPA